MIKHTILITFLLSIFSTVLAQINSADSTVQVIGYWDMNESQSYIITHEKLKVKDSDTTSVVYIKYFVDITIVDSTKDSYTINWFYHDFDIQSDNELVKKISSIAQDMTISIKTDELGVFQEIINWEEIRDYMTKAFSTVQKELKDIPNPETVLTQMKNMYNTKETIEAAAINEIHQFYTFHGDRYKLYEERQGNSKVMNLYGGEPFDNETILWLDEINEEDNNSIIRMIQTVNSEQLTEATFKYITDMASKMGKPGPKREEISPLKNEIITASRIHNYGWVIYSIATKEVFANNILNVEETIIEIQ